MKLNKLILPVACILFAGNVCMAQIMPWENRTETDNDPFAKSETAKTQGKLHLEDVVAGRLVQTKGIGAMNWMKDGERYSRMEPNTETGGVDIVAYRAKDNRREVIIPSSMFINKETGKPIAIRSISWSADNEKVLIYTNTQRVWRYDTRGDYWVLSLKDGSLRRLGKGLPESSMMFAKFSPDGTRVAYVSRNNLYVEDIASGQVTQLTHDGSDRIVNGTFDWVYEEEFACRDGFRCTSPIGRAIRKERVYSTSSTMWIPSIRPSCISPTRRQEARTRLSKWAICRWPAERLPGWRFRATRVITISRVWNLSPEATNCLSSS